LHKIIAAAALRKKRGVDSSKTMNALITPNCEFQSRVVAALSKHMQLLLLHCWLFCFAMHCAGHAINFVHAAVHLYFAAGVVD